MNIEERVTQLEQAVATMLTLVPRSYDFGNSEENMKLARESLDRFRRSQGLWDVGHQMEDARLIFNTCHDGELPTNLEETHLFFERVDMGKVLDFYHRSTSKMFDEKPRAFLINGELVVAPVCLEMLLSELAVLPLNVAKMVGGIYQVTKSYQLSYSGWKWVRDTVRPHIGHWHFYP